SSRPHSNAGHSLGPHSVRDFVKWQESGSSQAKTLPKELQRADLFGVRLTFKLGDGRCHIEKTGPLVRLKRARPQLLEAERELVRAWRMIRDPFGENEG